MAEKEIKYVTQGELAEFAKVVAKQLEQMSKSIEALGEPKELKTAFYRCSKEGCDFVTDDLGVFVEHTVDEKLRKRGWTPEEASGEPKTAPVKHRTFAEFLDCPECAPKFEKVLLEKGWKKPEPKREGLF